MSEESRTNFAVNFTLKLNYGLKGKLNSKVKHNTARDVLLAEPYVVEITTDYPWNTNCCFYNNNVQACVQSVIIQI